jgi:hypothetical protein
VIFRCALIQGAYPAYSKLNPPQKLDTLMYQMAGSKGCQHLCKILRGSKAARELQKFIERCAESVAGNKAAEVHQFDINDVRDALGVDAEAYAQQIFDYYASFGQPTKVDVIGSGKLEKFCRDVKLYDVLDPTVKEGNGEYEVALTTMEVDIIFKQNMLMRAEMKQRSEKLRNGHIKFAMQKDTYSPSGPTGGAADFIGFLTMISEFAPMKYVYAESKKDALRCLWDHHIVPLAKITIVETEKEEENLQNPPIKKLFTKVRKQLHRFFSKYAFPYKTHNGMEEVMDRNGLLKFLREFDVLPGLLSQREATKVLKEAFIRPIKGRGVGDNTPKCNFTQFEEVIGRAARIGFGKDPYGKKLKTTLQRCEAMVVHLDMSPGRIKTGFKTDPWVQAKLEEQDAEKKEVADKKKRK